MSDKPFDLAEVDALMGKELALAEDGVETLGDDELYPDKFDHGYSVGYRDAWRRALCILRNEDHD